MTALQVLKELKKEKWPELKTGEYNLPLILAAMHKFAELRQCNVSRSKPAVLEIKHCTDCPHFERRRMWTADSWEEAYDWFCKKENGKKIQGYVEWNEAADVKVPDWCPLRG